VTRQLVLSGFMGAGKSSAAKRLAERLDRRPVDIDQEIESAEGRSVAKIFREDGERAFRRIEAGVVARVLATAEPLVVALGGGALEDEQTRAIVTEHLVIYLEVRGEVAWRRVKGSNRPLAQDREQFEALLESRRANYEDCAHLIVRNEPRNAIDSARFFIERLLTRSPQTRAVWAVTAGGSYPAVFERGLLRRHDLWTIEGDFVTVSDANVAGCHEWLNHGIVIPPGEESKTLSEVERVCGAFAERGMTRRAGVAAVGGGVVGDLAGFAAAVYQRGIPVTQVPTTLVAQVDSAYGGKTGVDLPAAKNYIGAYHQPKAVLVDVEALSTLPPPDLASGYAEVIKTALIAGGRLWQAVDAGVNLKGEFPEAVVFDCARTKLEIVMRDERDSGRRQVLNLGHTIGHAIEAAAGYGNMRHGEAIGIGLLGALRLSGLDGLRVRIAELLAAAGLPREARGLDVDDVMARMRLDKKREDHAVPFVLVDGPGAVTHGHTVPDEEIRLAVEELIA
jgi:shikimate kinase/3-dehydroquinate synthase